MATNYRGNMNTTVELTKKELKAILFALQLDYETVANNALDWPEGEPEFLEALIAKLEVANDYTLSR